MQRGIEKTNDKWRILGGELDFYDMNVQELVNKTKTMCFQTFPPSWMQVSTVENAIYGRGNV